MRELLNRGNERLKAGKSALDVVTEMVEQLEVSGFYVAGKGSAPNTDGLFELDASIVDGATRKAGSVSAIENIVSSVRASRLILDNRKHVMMTSSGARWRDIRPAYGQYKPLRCDMTAGWIKRS